MHHYLKKIRASKTVILETETDHGSIDLNNNDDLSYTASLFVGTPLQNIGGGNFVFDTGSGYLTVPSSDCSSCWDAADSYDNTESSTYIDSVSGYTTTNLEYGSATLTGKMA